MKIAGVPATGQGTAVGTQPGQMVMAQSYTSVPAKVTQSPTSKGA